MLGVCLRKLCPQDSFGYAFREKKTVRKSTPGGCKTGPRGGPKWPPGGLRTALLCQLGPTWPPIWGRSWGALGGSAVLKGVPGPLLGALGGRFGTSQGLIWTIWTMSVALREK